ncbi:heterotrimeric G-protein alpha subunit, GPA3-like protein [Mycena belliarum]|uniref:Heterotrimeric G-protein alpha subunit, GPA3-like protein n=1 Tax=Mycena belliarum TaxID=1033014 RepID=A0AAD6TW03_9AGAR|nr:heterotrimeric G-protein alpha subunit, GPA3-like protein [Mycena belliae]
MHLPQPTGSGESGKSTIFKQMKIIHQKQFSRNELASYIPVIHQNVLDSIQAISMFMQLNKIDFVRFGNRHLGQTVFDSTSLTGEPVYLCSELADEIHQILQDPIIPQVVERRGEFYLMDNADYFLDAVLRIGKKGYVPTVADVLHARQATTGISEMHFNMGGLPVHMFDVGGQRPERKQWIHCFESVASIMFCTAVSEYDQVLLEEKNRNRMTESLMLFDSVINTPWFKNTSIILVLNKIDVFKTKLRKARYFPEYTGGDDISKATRFILWRFMQTNRAGLNVYAHLTQATDTSNIRRVFASVQENILRNTLQESGFL